MELGYDTKSRVIKQNCDEISGINEKAAGLHYYPGKTGTNSKLKYHSANSISQQFLYRLQLRSALLWDVLFFQHSLLIKKLIHHLYGIIYK